MKVDECTSKDVHTVGGGETPPCAGLTSNALPEAQSTTSAESSQTGVTTRNAHSGTVLKPQRQEDVSYWYVLRCTYGREKAAYGYLVAKGITAFYPTIIVVKLIYGRCKVVTESRLPKFEKGQLIQVVNGAFKGVIGRVTRWQEQYIVVVENLVTAYVPSAFLGNNYLTNDSKY